MTKLKQLSRQYSDGTLVAKDEQYPSFKGYQHIQHDASDVWNITHNIGSNYTINVFVNNELVSPSEIVVTDNCNIVLYFNRMVSGFANLIFLVDDKDGCTV